MRELTEQRPSQNGGHVDHADEGPVIVDANQVVQGSWELTSPWWLGLLGLSRAGLRLVLLPEIVLGEIVRNYRNEVESALTKRDAAIRRLNRLGVQADGTDVIDVDQEVESYRMRLNERLRLHRVEIDPTPDDGLRSLVEKLTARAQPFKENGSGLGDAVIWECVVRWATAFEQGVNLITSNSNDFGKGALAPDLLADLDRRGLVGRVKFAGSISEFMEQIAPDNPALHAQALAIAADLRESERPQIAINVAEAVKLGGVEVPDAMADIRINEVVVSSVDIESISTSEIEGLPTEWVVVTFRCAVELTVSGGLMAPHVGTGDLYGFHCAQAVMVDVDAVLDVQERQIDNFAVRSPVLLSAWNLGPFY